MKANESYTGRINRKLAKKTHMIEVASGRCPADLVLKNASYVNVFSNEICHGDIAVADGLIVGIGQYHGINECDMSGKIVLPGFMDAHIHLESAMVAPSEFVKAVLPHGTTTVVTDPHEIANVMGTDGIEYMLQATEGLPVDVYFMLPSCVPATPLDESGASLDYRAIDSFYDHPRVQGLAEVIVSFPQHREQLFLQFWEQGPVFVHGIHICGRNASMEMGFNILQIFRGGTVNIPGDIQIVLVLDLDFIVRNETSILGICGNLLVEGGHNLIDIPLPQTIFAAILHEVMAGIDHKDALALVSIRLVQNNNTGRDSGAVEQICRQADEALDIAFVDDGFSNGGFCIASEQNTMGQDNRSLARALQRLQNMKKPRKVTILFRGPVTIAVKSAVILQPVSPVFQGERWVRHGKVKALQYFIIGTGFKILRCRESITCLDLAGGFVVQDQVHFGKASSGNFFLLPVDRNFKGRFIRCANQESTRTAGGVYVPTDFDTIEKAFSGVKTAEKGIKQGLSRSITDSESPFSLYSVVDFCRSKVRRHRGV